MSILDQVQQFTNAAPGKAMERAFGADLAPQFALVVEGTDITGDLTRLVRSVTYESSLDVADKLSLELTNPGFALTDAPDMPPDLVSHKALQPGNEVNLYAGYGNADTFLGRAILAKHLPRYPKDGVPTLSVSGYDKSYLLMNMEGVAAGGKETRVRKAEGDKGSAGIIYAGVPGHEIVGQVADRWGLVRDIDPVEAKPFPADDGIIQPKGMSDYEFLKVLANIYDRDFWIDYEWSGLDVDSLRREWTLHWKEPVRSDQPMYRFVYGDGDRSSMLSIEFEYGIRDAITEISVLAWDEATETWLSVVEVEEAIGPDPKWTLGGARGGRATQGQNATGAQAGQVGQGTTDDQLITEALKSSTKFRLAAAGVAIDIVADRHFRSPQEAAFFAKAWFQQRKDQFVIARGRTVGVETLRHRQIHEIQGVGPRLSGAYQFLSVKHILSAGGGDLPYVCEFTANRVVK